MHAQSTLKIYNITPLTHCVINNGIKNDPLTVRRSRYSYTPASLVYNKV